MNTQPQPRPDHIPAPPEGYDYWGKGPLPHQSQPLTTDIIGLHAENPLGIAQGWSNKSCGCAESNHYAIRQGTELHRLNFGAPEKPAEPLQAFLHSSESLTREIRNLIEERDNLKRSHVIQARHICKQRKHNMKLKARIRELEQDALPEPRYVTSIEINHIPPPPEGFDFYGRGPLLHKASGGDCDDVACFDPRQEGDVWNTNFKGNDKNMFYALRRGTEIHALNFLTPDES